MTYTTHSWIRDGHHLNSTHWQQWKAQQPPLDIYLQHVLLGICLGDAHVFRTSTHAAIKFEQGALQKDFVYHLFTLLQNWRWITHLGIRYTSCGTIKSYWFKTFSHSEFTPYYISLYPNGCTSRCVPVTCLQRIGLSPIVLAYWMICDGSLHRDGRTLTLHTQCWNREQQTILQDMFYSTYGWKVHCRRHKGRYWVLEIPARYSQECARYSSPWILESIAYKIPRLR